MQQHYAQAHSPRQLLESARRAEADGNIDLAAHVSRYVVEHFAGSPESAEAYNSLMRLGQPPVEQALPAAPVPAPHPHKAMLPNSYGGAGAGGNGAMPVRYGPQPAQVHQASAWQPPQSHPVQMAPAAKFAPGGPVPVTNALANGAAGYAPAPVQRPAAPAPQPPQHNGAGYPAPMQTPVQTIAANFAPATPYRGAAPAPPAMIHHAPEVIPQYRAGRVVARLAFAAGGLMISAGVVSPVLAIMGFIGAAPSLLGTGLVACALIATGLLALLGGQTALAVFDQADNMRELVELERTRWGA